MGRFSAPGTKLLYKKLHCVATMKDFLFSNNKSFTQKNVSLLLAVYHCDGYEKFENSKYLDLNHHQDSFIAAMVDIPLSKREQPVSKRAENTTLTAPCGKHFTANGTDVPVRSIKLHCKFCDQCDMDSLVSILAKNAGAKDTVSTCHNKTLSPGALHCFYVNGDKLDPDTSQFSIAGDDADESFNFEMFKTLPIEVLEKIVKLHEGLFLSNVFKTISLKVVEGGFKEING